MEKEIKKDTPLKGAIIGELSLKFGLSKRTIRKCVDGQNVSPTAVTVKEQATDLTEKAKKLFPLLSSISK